MEVQTDKQMLLLNKVGLLEYIRGLEAELLEANKAVIELSAIKEAEAIQEATDLMKTNLYNF